MSYIDLNQCRAGKVAHPKDNEWSSYGYYAYGKEDPLITPAPSYLALGDTPQQRQEIYREMVEILFEQFFYGVFLHISSILINSGAKLTEAWLSIKIIAV